jgi:hypothetical protein
MFRVNSTRKNTKRAISPLRPATDLSGNITLSSLNTGVVETVASAGAGVGVEPKRYADTMDKTFTNFLEAETAATLLTKPWLRLERGLRLQKIRAFTENYPSLTAEEKNDLYHFLVKANDNKQLNTKSQITYENGVITSIKGLKIIHTGDPSKSAIIKIEGTRQTKRNTNN